MVNNIHISLPVINGYNPPIPTYIWIDDVEDGPWAFCYDPLEEAWGPDWESQDILEGYALINGYQVPIIKG